MSWIERGWYNRSASNYLLLPFTLLFWLVSSMRRLAFDWGIFKSHRVSKPVIVVGNISVGGNGKTPFVIRLVELLQAQGLTVGVISRGYGGQSDSYPIAVESQDTSRYGDEPVLIQKRTGCPVVVGPDRVKNCELLIAQFNVDVIVSDDGMQHYRLKRDMEIAIVDAAREFGNGWLLPTGPLRELKSRLNSVDYVIYNGLNSQQLCYQIQAGQARLVTNDELIPDQQIQSTPMQAICGIGNPARFEQTVKNLGITMNGFTSFTDHYHYTAQDFQRFGEQPVLMTEKDAVKCRAFARPNWAYLPIDAQLPAGFEQQLLNHIQKVIKNHGI